MAATRRPSRATLFLVITVASVRADMLGHGSLQAQTDATSLRVPQRKTTIAINIVNKNLGGEDGGGGGGGSRWGWGAGGGGGWRGWGCGGQTKSNGGRGRGPRHRHWHRNGVSKNQEYIMGEFAQCLVRGRCKGVRLDWPLHCGGPCLYDCHHMCKAHCRRP